jgi:hypothetical protein
MHDQCLCEHSDLRYCKVCKVVYCLKCGREWVEKNPYSYTWYGSTTWMQDSYSINLIYKDKNERCH